MFLRSTTPSSIRRLSSRDASPLTCIKFAAVVQWTYTRASNNIGMSDFPPLRGGNRTSSDWPRLPSRTRRTFSALLPCNTARKSAQYHSRTDGCRFPGAVSLHRAGSNEQANHFHCFRGRFHRRCYRCGRKFQLDPFRPVASGRLRHHQSSQLIDRKVNRPDRGIAPERRNAECESC